MKMEQFAETANDFGKIIAGISSFLKAICEPVAVEFGLMMRDQVRFWRLNNLASIIKKSKGRLEYDGKDLQLRANARVGLAIVEEGSKVDDDELQELWAGLFSSSCTEDGKDDSNLVFVDLLRRLSVVEARILKYACEHAEKILYPNGLIVGGRIVVPINTLKEISGTDDIYRLDRELDHLSSISLFASNFSGFDATDVNLNAEIVPTSLALNLYYKTNCIGKSPIDFWGDNLRHASPEELKTEEEKINDLSPKS